MRALSRFLRRVKSVGSTRLIATVAVAFLFVLVVALAGSGAMTVGLRRIGLVGAGHPANDAFANVATIVNDDAAGSTADATAESSEVTSGLASASDGTVWFSWAPTDPGMTTVVADGTGATAVHVYRGSALTSLTKLDLPASSSPTTPATGATTTFGALGGGHYVVQVVAPTTSGAAFTLSMLQPAAGAPANDPFSAAVPVDSALAALANGASGTAASGTTAGATAEASEPATSAGPASHSVWYVLHDPYAGGGRVRVNVGPLVGSPGGLRTGAWSGVDVAHLTALATNATDTAEVDTPTPGHPVFISVDGPPAFFSLTLTPIGIAPTDGTPPVVTCLPPTGWTRDVTIACTATDAGSGLANAADASFTLTANVADGVALATADSPSRSVCDKTANCTTAGPFAGLSIDRSPPVVTCGQTPTGWSSGAVTVSCSIVEDGSGLPAGTASSFDLVATAPAGATVDASPFSAHDPVCDVAGNCTAVDPPSPARIDQTAPALSCGAAPAGWSKDEVRVACTATDGGSGLADTSAAAFDLVTTVGDTHASSSAATGTRSVCDAIGNCATAGPVTGIRVDRIMPSFSCAPAGNAWRAGTIGAVACSAADVGSGLADGSPAAFSLTATVAAGTESTVATGTQALCDHAGNCTTAGPIQDVHIDDAPPVVQCGAVPTTWQSGAVSVGCSAKDGGSGLLHANDAVFGLEADASPGTESTAVTFGSREVCDAVGHCATTPALGAASVDRKPPTFSCDPVPAGASPLEINVTCHATDAGSGLADAADETFHLKTTVGRGNVNPNAATSTRTLCDAVGNCVSTGPFFGNVDRTLPPPGRPPVMSLPGAVGVLAAIPPVAAGTSSPTLAVPYPLPAVSGGAGSVTVACSPERGSRFPLGLTIVSCGATDDADQATEGTFWLSMVAAPTLAPGGPARAGAGWRAVGAHYAPTSAVAVTLDDAPVAAGAADANGLVDIVFTMPASTRVGAHTLVVNGVDANGRPLLVVTPFVVRTDASPLPPNGTPTTTTTVTTTVTTATTSTTVAGGTQSTGATTTTSSGAASVLSSGATRGTTTTTAAATTKNGAASAGAQLAVAVVPGAPASPDALVPVPPTPPGASAIHPSLPTTHPSASKGHAGLSRWWPLLPVLFVLGLGLGGGLLWRRRTTAITTPS